MQRHEQNNRRVLQFRNSYPTSACPTPSYLGAISYALLAPALVEALSDSLFASRTHIVPGEADDYCASYAKNHSKSIILTSDTDLILYDYPLDTLISFFSDIDLSTDIKVQSPKMILEKMQLSSLITFAFALRDGHQDTAINLISNARKIDLHSNEYGDFSRRYVAPAEEPAYLTNPASQSKILPMSDVRVSEFIHQTLESSADPLVYLPLLVEDPNQASAWNVGHDLRVLAYSIMAKEKAAIHEYKRKAQGITVQEISVHDRADLIAHLKDFERQIASLGMWAKSKDMAPTLLWSMFALSLVLPELSTPPTLTLVLRALNGDFDNSWSYIQLLARMQAAMYSLRMLKQVSATFVACDQDQAQELRNCLIEIEKKMDDFPPISDMFTVAGQSKSVLGNHDELSALIQEVYASAGVELPFEQNSSKKKRRQAREADRKKRKAEQRQQSQLHS